MADERLQQEIDAIRADVAKLGQNIAELAQVIQALGEEAVDDVKDSVDEGIDSVSEELQRRVEAARAQGRKVSGDFEETVRKYPLGSLLGAFGVGIIIARLLNPGGRR